MKTINIYGDNSFAEHSKVREACRGIVVQDGMILLTYEVNTDQWFIPGGGLEDAETIRECCIRELSEETGFSVDPLDHFLTINEYYEEWLFISYYFVCKITGKTNRQLTVRETEVGLEPRWIPLQEAVNIFSKHQVYAHDEMKRGAYLREHNALTVFQGKTGIDLNHLK